MKVVAENGDPTYYLMRAVEYATEARVLIDSAIKSLETSPEGSETAVKFNTQLEMYHDMLRKATSLLALARLKQKPPFEVKTDGTPQATKARRPRGEDSV